MSEQHNRQVVEALWRAFDAFEFDAAGDLLHDAFICEWPQSGERIRGRDNFVAVNTYYPGRWRVSVQKLVASGNDVVTECLLRCDDQTVTAVSFFTLHEGHIIRLREYFPDPMEAQPWRAQWVERL
ncbi:MAG: nuclear transport factor 2 family protein [Anaerolineae bacterium]|nr:nuclear transport factor 2 family protein [Anaerolineae bacterium]